MKPLLMLEEDSQELVAIVDDFLLEKKEPWESLAKITV